MQYLITRSSKHLPNTPIVMLDGKCWGWNPTAGDFCFNHHDMGGELIQIDEIPMGFCYGRDVTYVGTHLDSDVCVAAAWCQVNPASITLGAIRRLQAISYACDYLEVPHDLADLADFAKAAVAALEVELKFKYPLCTLEEMSPRFREGTEWLLRAIAGESPYPGELGEARKFWQDFSY